MNQLFVISGETWDALSSDEVFATADAMKELDIFKLPYPVVDIWLGANDAVGWNLTTCTTSEGTSMETLRKEAALGLYEIDEASNQYKPAKGSGFVFEFRGVTLDSSVIDIAMHATPGTLSGKFYKCCSTKPVKHWDAKTLHKQLVSALIVLLGTKNAVKSTRENKLAKLGIGKKPDSKYHYITTISLPRVEERENDKEHAPGASVAPHLRRGHIRRQHYGPQNALIKQIWIEPVFVNADPAWVSTRERYNVSL